MLNNKSYQITAIRTNCHENPLTNKKTNVTFLCNGHKVLQLE